MEQSLYFEMKEKELKNLYEKFCFLNNFIEESLSDPNSVKILEKYGFTLVSDDNLTQTFTRIIAKN